MQEENNLSAKFNMALCCWKANLHKQALEILENAEKRIPAPTVQETFVASELETTDAASNGYKAPMLQEEPPFFRKSANYAFCVKADLMFESGAMEELKRLLPMLQGKGFTNIEVIVCKLHANHEKQEENCEILGT